MVLPIAAALGAATAGATAASFATPLLLGIAGFGISKAMGASTKNALFAGLSGGALGMALPALGVGSFGSGMGALAPAASSGPNYGANIASNIAMSQSGTNNQANPYSGLSGFSMGTPQTSSFMANSSKASQMGNNMLQAQQPQMAQMPTQPQTGGFFDQFMTPEYLIPGIASLATYASAKDQPTFQGETQAALDMAGSQAERDAQYQARMGDLQGLAQRPTYDDTGGMAPQTVEEILKAKTGAFVEKYVEGGINYLPSKIDHDENNETNYVRAKGYVEDGSGTGDKDEDTMLAQLADGEFVSRADAVLGAGIMAGANPTSAKDMRGKGASFFYDQQKKFKRVFDLVNGDKTG
jgi:hypothetical protein